MPRARNAIALTAVLALATAGCAGQDDPEETTGPETPTPSATPLVPVTSPPVPGENPETPEDPATWLIETDRIGPIELGDDFGAALSALPDDWMNDEQCAWVAYWSAPDGSYLVSFQRAAEGETEEVTGVTVEWLSDASDIGPRTEQGLGVGAASDAVLEVFPEAQEVDSPIDGITYLRIAGDEPEQGALFFQYLEGGEGAQSVSVTTLDTPSYEACA
jgi:hypothetical protein